MAGKHFNISVFIRWAAEEMELEEAYRASLVKVIPSPRLRWSMHRDEEKGFQCISMASMQSERLIKI